MISARAFKTQFEDVKGLMTTRGRAAAQQWLTNRETHGWTIIEQALTFEADRLNRAFADAVNASVLAGAVAASVRAGRLNPAEGMRQIQQLDAIAREAQSVLPEVRAQVEQIREVGPLDAFDDLMERFPVMAPRVPPAPGLPAPIE